MNTFKNNIKAVFFRFLGAFFIVLPLRVSLFIGRILGNAGYFMDHRHRGIAYKNLRRAFSSSKTPSEMRFILRRCFVNLAQSFIEMLSLPKIDRAYLDKFVEIEGLRYLDENISKGKGVILLASHYGSWELAMSACPILGYPFSVIVQTQRDTYLNHLLNAYRQNKGYKLIPVRNSMREVITDLKSGRVLGIVADHGGGKEGRLIEFLGYPASTPTGAVKFAQKLDLPLIMVYSRRIKGCRHKIVLSSPLSLVDDMDTNLRMINKYIEDYIVRSPEQYLWFYKRWKYSPRRNILLLTDGKTGHLRQSQSLVKAAEKSGRWDIETRQVQVKYRSRTAKFLMPVLFLLCGFGRWGSDWLMRFCLSSETYREIISFYCDMVISAGSSISGINILSAMENLASSVCVMKPGIFSFKRFDLVVVPRHDRSLKFENTVVTEGALNCIDAEYMEKGRDELLSRIPHDRLTDLNKVIGIILGGDSKGYALTVDEISMLLSSVALWSRKNGYKILLTTSRRTPEDVLRYIKQNCFSDSAYAFIVLENENNFEGAMGGILALSRVLICSPESISMISESSASAKEVLVFGAEKLKGKKQSLFLRNMSEAGRVRLVPAEYITSALKGSLNNDHPAKPIMDMDAVLPELYRILG